MSDTRQQVIDKLTSLRDRLAAEQRRLILQAAEADTVPPVGLIGRIAQLEGAIVAGAIVF